MVEAHLLDILKEESVEKDRYLTVGTFDEDKLDINWLKDNFLKLNTNLEFLLLKTIFPNVRYKDKKVNLLTTLENMHDGKQGTVEFNSFDYNKPNVEMFDVLVSTKTSWEKDISLEKAKKKFLNSCRKFIQQALTVLSVLVYTDHNSSICPKLKAYTERLESILEGWSDYYNVQAKQSFSCNLVDGFVMEGKTAYVKKHDWGKDVKIHYAPEHSDCWREEFKIYDGERLTEFCLLDGEL